ncbi:Ribonuclease H domain [Sesbania bispinosa]|nr:Ribonuclease H domain [Sesbania bispinosa]
MLNIPKHRMRISDITLNTFHGKPVETRGCVNAVLEVGPIRTINVFQVVDSDPSYHMLLGQPWIHLHQCIPSTLHQCIKSNFKGKEIEIPRAIDPFEVTEAHLIDASLFDEVAPPGSGRIVKEHHVLLDPSRRPQNKGSFPHPMPTHKRKSENGVEKEYLPNGEQQEEELEEVDISEDPEKKRPLFIGRDLKKDEKESLLRLLLLKVVEARYPKQERYCLALVYAAQKYRHYFEAHTIEVVSKSDGIKYMLHNPSLTRRMSRWALMMSEGNEEEVVDEVRGGIPEVNVCKEENKMWWTLKFDGSPANPDGGAGVVLSNKEGEVFTISYHIGFPCTNNEAEYEALILGLHMARDLNVKQLKIKGDSKLIIKQLKGEYGVKEASLAAYRDEALKLTEAFEGIEASHIPRAENRHVDALATIGSKETRSEGEEVVVFRRKMQRVGMFWPTMKAYCDQVQANCASCREAKEWIGVNVIEEDWRQPMKQYLEKGTLPLEHREADKMKRKAE